MVADVTFWPDRGGISVSDGRVVQLDPSLENPTTVLFIGGAVLEGAHTRGLVGQASKDLLDFCMAQIKVFLTSPHRLIYFLGFDN